MLIEKLHKILDNHSKWVRREGGEKADLSNTNLAGMSLKGVNLQGAILTNANLFSADLESANLGFANLYGANLGFANLRNARLDWAILQDANLGDTDLTNANLRYTCIKDANFSSALLLGAQLPEGVYQVVGLSYIVTYDSVNDVVVEGLGTEDGGYSLGAFKKKVEENFGEDYEMLKEYEAVIKFFEEVRNNGKCIYDQVERSY